MDKYRVLALSLLLGFGQLISAQKTISDDSISGYPFNPVQLQEIVVTTGTGTEYYLKNAPVQTEVISGQALSAYAGKNMEEILSGLSPSFDFNPSDMGSGIKMNGLGNSYILILIDGRKMNGDVGGQNDLTRINLADVERIEIIKGAASALYGSDAIAGVVNIIKKKPKGKINFNNTTRIGSYADIRQSNVFSFNSGKWRSTTKLNYKHSDGWQNTTQELYRNLIYEHSVTKTSNAFDSYQVDELITYTANEKLNFNASAVLYGKDIYRPCGQPQYRTFGMFYRDQSYGLDAKYVLNKNNYLIVESSYDNDKYSHRYTAPTVEEYITPEGVILHPVFYDGDVSLQSCQQRVLLHAKGVFNWGKLQRLSVGSEYQLDILESPYRITSDKESATMISLYAQDELNFTENFNVTAGLRLVHHNEFGTKPTSKISVFYKPNDFSFLASYSNGFKTPTLKELYYRYERTMMSKLRLYLGNPDLKPQTSNYFSTGIQYNNNKWSASISPYYNRVDDMIQLVEVPTSYEDKVRDVDKTMQYKNIEDAKIKGIDVVFEIHLNKNWLAGGGYSYVDAHANMLNEDGIMEHVIIDGTSFHRANLRIVWNHDWAKYKLGIGIFGNAESKSYYRYYGNADGYVTCRLNTTHHLKTKKSWKVELNAGIDNLFDYHETKPYGYNYASTTPGRTFYITFILKYEKNNNIN